MSRGFYNISMRMVQAWDLPAEPRAPIAIHMDWTRGLDGDFNSLGPDNFNRIIIALRPIECKFIEDNIFYRDLEHNRWYSFYYVPQDQMTEFEAWAKEQNSIAQWTHSKPPAPRPRKGLLFNSRAKSDLTPEERLFTMGYYAKLGSKYFSDNDTILLERLGPIRAHVLNGDYLQV